jgi:hypothetical protein
LDNHYLHFMVTQALVDSLKKIFGESAKDYMPVIYKLASGLKSQDDVNMAAQFFGKLYEHGYTKSVEAHKDILSQFGFSAKMQINAVTDQNLDDGQTACKI